MQTADELHLNDIMEKEEHLDKLSKCLETLSSNKKTTVELFYLQSKCYKRSKRSPVWNGIKYGAIYKWEEKLKICMDRQILDGVETTTPAIISTT